MDHDKRTDGFWVRSKKDLRGRVLAGTAVVVPLAITFWILRWLFEWLASFLGPTLDAILMPWLARLAGEGVREYGYIIVPVLAVFLMVLMLYLIGALTRALIGRKFISMGESILLKVPLVRSIYSASKQVVQAISLPDRAAFKSVVLVHFPHPHMWALGFLTGTAPDPISGRTLYRIFIPTTPNPTTGFFELAEASELLLTDIPIDEAFKMVISGGILWPTGYDAKPMPPPPPPESAGPAAGEPTPPAHS